MGKITWIWRLFEFPANIYFSAISEKAKCQNKKPGGQASAAVLGPCVSVFFSVFHVFSKQTLISRKNKSWKKKCFVSKNRKMELKETPNSAEQEDHSLLTSQPPVHIIKSTSKDGRQGKGKQDIFCLNLKWGENSKERWFLQDIHLSKTTVYLFRVLFLGDIFWKTLFSRII